MPGFRALVPEQVWHDLLKSAIRKDFKANETLLHEGASETHLLVLQAGRVLVTTSGLLVAVRGPGELLGEMAALDGTARSAAVVALEPCVAYLIHAEPFVRLLARNNAEPLLREYLVGKIRQAQPTTATTPIERTADLLAKIVELAPDDRRVPLSQTRIAQVLDLSRRAVHEAIGELRDHGLLSDTSPITVADLEALRQIVT